MTEKYEFRQEGCITEKEYIYIGKIFNSSLLFDKEPHYLLRELLRSGAPLNSKDVGVFLLQHIVQWPHQQQWRSSQFDKFYWIYFLLKNSKSDRKQKKITSEDSFYLFWDLILPGMWWHHQWHNWSQKEMVTPVSTREVIFHKKETQTCSTSVLFLFFPLVLPFSLLDRFGFMGNHRAWTLT